jgi:general secretion pathway protein H
VSTWRLSVTQRSRGFTLLELLVVLVMIGIILGVAVLSIGDGGRGDRIRQEGRRVATLFNLLSQEAVLNSTEYGVLLKPDGYSFLRFVDDNWQPVDGDSLLVERSLPQDMEVTLYMDKVSVSLEPPALGIGDEKKLKPQLIFYSSAERTPFELELSYRDPPELRQRIEGPLLGDVLWQRESVEP